MILIVSRAQKGGWRNATFCSFHVGELLIIEIEACHDKDEKKKETSLKVFKLILDLELEKKVGWVKSVLICLEYFSGKFKMAQLETQGS